jgi:hypothetical protein
MYMLPTFFFACVHVTNAPEVVHHVALAVDLGRAPPGAVQVDVRARRVGLARVGEGKDAVVGYAPAERVHADVFAAPVYDPCGNNLS